MRGGAVVGGFRPSAGASVLTIVAVSPPRGASVSSALPLGWLIGHAFRADVDPCTRCGGPMRWMRPPPLPRPSPGCSPNTASPPRRPSPSRGRSSSGGQLNFTFALESLSVLLAARSVLRPMLVFFIACIPAPVAPAGLSHRHPPSPGATIAAGTHHRPAAWISAGARQGAWGQCSARASVLTFSASRGLGSHEWAHYAYSMGPYP